MIGLVYCLPQVSLKKGTEEGRSYDLLSERQTCVGVGRLEKIARLLREK